MPYSLVNMQIVMKQIRNVRKLQRVWVHSAVVIMVIIGQDRFQKLALDQTIWKDGSGNVSQSTNVPVKLLDKQTLMKRTKKLFKIDQSLLRTALVRSSQRSHSNRM